MHQVSVTDLTCENGATTFCSVDRMNSSRPGGQGTRQGGKKKEMSKTAFAIAAHPDDVEFAMAGTLLLLGQSGYELHYMTMANGSCGSATMSRQVTIDTRSREAKEASAVLGAVYHEPLVDDLMIYYTPPLVAKLCAIIRQVRPTILLVPSPVDYMEDHTNTSRLAVTAAFCRNMPNFPTDPPAPVTETEVAVYHAAPVWLRDQVGNRVRPQFCVDVSSVLQEKRRALACHRSQKEWLDVSQGQDSYLKMMEDLCAEVGRLVDRPYAESWFRHLPPGFCGESFDPLAESLGKLVTRLP